MIVAATLVAGGTCSIRAEAEEILQSNVAVKDVKAAFEALRHQGEWLAAWPQAGMPFSGLFGHDTGPG